MTPRRRARGDDGVVLVLFALLMVGMLTMVAIVVDLGGLRAERRESQKAVDMAGLAAGFHLSGRGSGSSATSDPQAACRAALHSLTSNVAGFPSSATVPCGALPETAKPPDCTATTAMQTLSSSGSAPFEVRISYPVPDSEIAEPAFAGGAGELDGTNRCERMRIELAGSRDPSFGKVVGAGPQGFSGSAVVRGAAASIAEGSPAFLILERTECMALTNSAGGSGNLGIIIRAPGPATPDLPGLAHVDSNATSTGSDCGGGSTAVYATSLSSGTPSITVDDSPDGNQEGIIAINALRNGNAAKAYYQYTDGVSGGLSVEPTPGQIVSRRPVDLTYNPAATPTITNLHATAYQAVAASGAPTGAHAPTDIYECGAEGELTGERVHIVCPGGFGGSNKVVSFPQASQVSFSHDVSLGNNSSVSAPLATRVVIRGAMAAPQGLFTFPSVREMYVGGGISSGGGGRIAINSTSPSGCTGGSSNATRLAVFGGPVNVSGPVAFCSTFVYLAGAKSSANATYVRHQTVTGGNCTEDLPCPKTVSNPHTTAYFRVSGAVRWTAPNEYVGTKPPDGMQGIEDLALWTESAALSDVRSGGSVAAEGVFFLPNSPVEFRSPALATPRNAQFIARTLDLKQGTMEMRPVASDVITIPVVGSYGLIR